MKNPDEKPVIKRFYKEAAIDEDGDAYLIVLDGRSARTPGKQVLGAPFRKLAEAIAAEWNAQGDELDMASMWLTRQQMVVIDRAEEDRLKWQDTFVSYTGSELLCYRAEAPAELVSRQQEIWQPYLDWAAETHGIALDVISGIIAVEQPANSLKAARGFVQNLSAEKLFALVSATETIKSAILALALVEGFRSMDEIFTASLLDETFQAEKWGVDTEAAEREAMLREEFEAIARYLELVS